MTQIWPVPGSDRVMDVWTSYSRRDVGIVRGDEDVLVVTDGEEFDASDGWSRSDSKKRLSGSRFGLLQRWFEHVSRLEGEVNLVVDRQVQLRKDIEFRAVGPIGVSLIDGRVIVLADGKRYALRTGQHLGRGQRSIDPASLQRLRADLDTNDRLPGVKDHLRFCVRCGKRKETWCHCCCRACDAERVWSGYSMLWSTRTFGRHNERTPAKPTLEVLDREGTRIVSRNSATMMLTLEWRHPDPRKKEV